MNKKDRARKIKMILMDVDGTLTDGTLLVLPDGEELKTYNVKDGTGILLAHLAGLKTGIITGKISKSLEKRTEKLKIIAILSVAIRGGKGLYASSSNLYLRFKVSGI